MEWTLDGYLLLCVPFLLLALAIDAYDLKCVARWFKRRYFTH